MSERRYPRRGDEHSILLVCIFGYLIVGVIAWIVNSDLLGPGKQRVAYHNRLSHRKILPEQAGRPTKESATKGYIKPASSSSREPSTKRDHAPPNTDASPQMSDAPERPEKPLDAVESPSETRVTPKSRRSNKQTCTETFEFDDQCRLTNWTDVSGVRTTYEYDNENRVAAIRRPAGTVKFSYDAMGNRTRMDDPSGSTQYEYDALNRLVAIVVKHSPPKRVEYRYDPWQRIDRVVIKNMQNQPEYSVSLNYDIAGRLRHVSDHYGRVSYSYRPDTNQVVRSLPNGLKTTYTFRPHQGLSSIEHRTASSDLLARHVYSRPEGGSRIAVRSETPRGIDTNTISLPSTHGHVPSTAAVGMSSGSQQVTPKFLHDGDGRMIRRNDTEHPMNYLVVPIGPAMNLVGEYDQKGPLTRAYVTGPMLALEHTPNIGTTHYIEGAHTASEVLPMARMLTGESPIPSRNLLVSDLGINQHARQDFNFAYPDHVVYRMPSADPTVPTYHKSPATVKQEVYELVTNYFQTHPNTSTLELRTAHDVNTLGYGTGGLPFSKAQKRADQFTVAALEGIHQAKTDIGLNTVGVFGSNAGKTYTNGLNSLAKQGIDPIDHITFDDAQVHRTGVAALMKRVGGDRVTFFTERGGFHGSLETFGIPNKPSDYSRGELVANPNVVRELAKEFAGTNHYHFNPPGPLDTPRKSHIYAAEHPWESISVKTFDSHGISSTVGQQIRPVDVFEDRFNRTGQQAAPTLPNVSFPAGGHTFTHDSVQYNPTQHQLEIASLARLGASSNMSPGGSTAVFRFRTPQSYQDFDQFAGFLSDSVSIIGKTRDLNYALDAGTSTGNVQAPGSEIFKGFGYGMAVGRDIAGFMNDDRDIRISVIQHGVLGRTGEKLANEHIVTPFLQGFAQNPAWGQVAGKYSGALGGLGGELTGAAFNAARGELDGITALEHGLDSVFGASIYVLALELSGGSVVAAQRAAGIATMIPDLGRQWTLPAFEAEAMYRARTGASVASNWIWQAARAVETDTFDTFQRSVGEASLTDTIRWYAPWLHDSFSKFDVATRTGDLATMVNMLHENVHIRSHVDKTYGRGSADSLANHLEQRIAATTPFNVNDAEIKLGGILLAATATFPDDLGEITGAVYDRKTDRLVLLGNGNRAMPSIKPEHLAVALRCNFGDNFDHPVDPKFSLDPAIPTQPDGKWQRGVHIPERELVATDFARVLYEADWVLKHYGFGLAVRYDPWLPKDTDPDSLGMHVEVWNSGKMRTFTKYEVKRKGPVAGMPGSAKFRTIAELLAALRGKASASALRSRMWIISDMVEVVEGHDGFEFGEVTMKVKAMKQVIGEDGTLRDADTNDPVAVKFGRLMTLFYDHFAEQESSFAELKECSKALGLAKWLRKRNVPVDLDWIDETLAKPADSIKVVTRLTHTHKGIKPIAGGVQIHTVLLAGGVDLSVHPEYREDKAKLDVLSKAVENALARSSSPILDIAHEESIRGVVLPLTRGGKEMWHHHGSQVRNGIKYLFGESGKVVSSIDPAGRRIQYEWGTNGHLKSMARTTASGWILKSIRIPGGSKLELTTPTEHQLLYELDSTGRLTQVSRDGQPYARCTYGDKNDVTVAYADGRHKEYSAYNDQGKLVEYCRTTRNDDGTSTDEQATLSWNAEGNISEISIGKADKVQFGYSDGRLISCSRPNGEIVYEYDTAGNVIRIRDGNENNLTLSYEAGSIASASLNVGKSSMAIQLNDGQIVLLKEPDGTTTTSIYDDTGRLVELKRKGVPICFDYGKDNRLTRATTPDVLEVTYDYTDRSDTKTSQPTRLRAVHVKWWINN